MSPALALAYHLHKFSPAPRAREFVCYLCGEFASVGAGIHPSGEFKTGRVQRRFLWPFCWQCLIESRFEWWIAEGAPDESKSRRGRRRARRVRQRVRGQDGR